MLYKTDIIIKLSLIFIPIISFSLPKCVGKWSANGYAVLKRYAERQAQLERQSYTSEMKFSKMKLGS